MNSAKDLFERLKDLECDQLLKELRSVKDEDTIGWARYYFMGPNEMEKKWQLIVINRYLERDKFFRNILPQWLGTAFGLLSFVVAVFALVVALNPSK